MTAGCKLRQSTASQVVILGPFFSSTDGSAATGLSIANTDIILVKRGSTSSTTKNSGGATHITGGLYYATFDATDTDTLGNLVVTVAKSGAMTLRQDLEVLTAVRYDAEVLGTDYLQVDVEQWKDSAAPAMSGDAYGRLGAPAGATLSADIAAVKAETALIVEDTGTTLPSSIAALPTDADVNAACDTAISDAALATASSLATVAGYIDTEVAAILADTNELQTDLTNGGRLDLLIDAIKAKTDTIAAAPTAAAIADQVWDEALSGHTGAGTAGNALSTASSGGVDPSVLADAIWDEIMSGHTSAGSAGAFLALLNSYLDATVSSRLATAGYTAPPTAVAVRQEMDSNSTKLSDILTDTGTTLDTKINTLDSILDNIHDTDLPAVKADTNAIETVVNLIPTLGEIEASTVLAKEATIEEVKNLIGHYTISSPVFDADGNMTSCTITTPGDTYTVTATYDVDKNLSGYTVTP